ncbi:MAG: hypothetical protein Q4G02_02505 [bacterium]|nr:hypothetical protein [bacterium]
MNSDNSIRIYKLAQEKGRKISGDFVSLQAETQSKNEIIVATYLGHSDSNWRNDNCPKAEIVRNQTTQNSIVGNYVIKNVEFFALPQRLVAAFV